MKIKGRVIRCLSNKFVVRYGDNLVTCQSLKKVKNDSGVLAGDIVTISEMVDHGEKHYVLDSVLPRKNSLIRPPIANLDQIIIVVAPLPIIDFYLIDKLIINAHSQDLGVIICLNKTDISSSGQFEQLVEQFGGVADSVVSVCAATGDIGRLISLLSGKLSCLAGQSAVGKSSLINSIFGLNRQVGELSGNERGKNTTTGIELIEVGEDGYIADTPGFSMLDIHNIDYTELDLFYSDYVSAATNCKYHRCTHTVEPDCAVKRLVNEGSLNKDRYERYVNMFNELKAKKRENK